MRQYLAIDLKSFYASVECVDRGLDPLTTNLVVADLSRTEKTICLAVTPSLKAYGIPGRPRLFQVQQYVERLRKEKHIDLDYIVATPRMARYLEVSGKVYDVYLQFVAPEDIHVYSVDEVFIDVTNYLDTYKTTARALCMKMIREVLRTTGITATAGIGTNLYLAKIAMDIVAKKMQPDKDGVRIAELDEISYRRELWEHLPLTDFWRVGPGITERLKKYNIRTMGDIARCALGGPNDFYNENLLYKILGINAELLLDHAWGRETCLIDDIKKYRPKENSLSSGQVLQEPYTFAKGLLSIREMAEALILDLVSKNLLCNQIGLHVGYEKIKEGFLAPARGAVNLGSYTNSREIILPLVDALYRRIVNSNFMVRRLNIVANHVYRQGQEPKKDFEEMDLFAPKNPESKSDFERESRRQMAIIKVQGKYGKNALLKGADFQEGATARQRNEQIGGHRA